MQSVLRRFWSDESGQDLIEYALLTATIGLSAYWGVDVLRTSLHDFYAKTDTYNQSDNLVETPNP